MKYKSQISALFVKFVLGVILLPFTSIEVQAENAITNASDVYVQVQKAKIRQAPQQWASSVVDVQFGDKLSAIESKDSWVKVKTEQALEGFLHLSAITQKKVILSASTDALLNTKVDDSDVYLAGKGFNDDVLKSYAASDPKLDFSVVDRMLAESAIDAQQLYSFIHEGQLQ